MVVLRGAVLCFTTEATRWMITAEIDVHKMKYTMTIMYSDQHWVLVKIKTQF
jgi:hypothetical protein